MTVAIYSRVSTREQQPENQLIQLREFCLRAGHHVHGEYTDRISGGRADRPEFLRMLADASQHKFDAVLVWSLDRFTREGTRRTIHYLNLLDSYGVAFKSYTEQYLDTTGIFKDAIISLLAALANQEKVRLSERVRAGMDRAKSMGREAGRPGKNEAIVEKILKLHRDGLTNRRIASLACVSPSTVAKYLSATAQKHGQ